MASITSNICCGIFFISAALFSHCDCNSLNHNTPIFHTEREALEIIIGGGGGTTPFAPAPAPEYDCPPPPPPPPPPICPPHPPPPSPPSPRPASPSPRPASPSPRPASPSPRPASPSPPIGPFPSENVKRDYKIIQNFKSRIIDDPFKITSTWTGFDVCNRYKGFACDIVPDMQKTAVSAVDFNEYYFGGPNLNLSGFLEELRDLAIFHANSNNFTGLVPKTFGQRVRYLYELDFSNNKYTGGFPLSILGAVNLTFIDLRYNFFTGPIPSQLFNMDVVVIFLNNNQFSQELPHNLGSTPALYLTFANNQFTGPIPRSIGKAKNLLEVLFLNNKLIGCLPYEIGLLKNLIVLDVGTNRLTGPIPHSFGCLAKIQFLNLAMNEFYGAVPEMLCKQKNVKNLTLSYNYFTQVGPECMELIHMKVLDVRMNCILGLPNQRSAGECKSFFSKPRICPNERSLNYIPCKRIDTANQGDTVAASTPRTYDALKPHRLRV